MKQAGYTITLIFLMLGTMAGCASAPDAGGRQSSVTVYGTVDTGVSVTRDK